MRMMKRQRPRTGPRFAAIALLAALQGCATSPPKPPPVRAQLVVEAAPAKTGDWRAVVTGPDARRLDGIEQAWADGLAGIRGGALLRRVKAEGALLDPAAALPRSALTPGSYRCRILRLGGPGRKRGFIVFPSFFCHVADEGELLSLTKQTGSERPGGYLWEDGRNRMIFLGSVALGDETAPPAYGKNPARDMVGIVERVAPFQYRLVMPSPRAAARLDVLELVPALPPELQRP